MQRKRKLQSTHCGRLTAILLCILITAVFSLPNTMPAKAAGGTMSGSGTAADPYIVEDADDFAAMTPDQGKNYKLAKDITVTSPYNQGDNGFQGKFDGDGHTITVQIESNSNYTGLFAKLGEGASVSDLKLGGLVKYTGSNRRAYTGGGVSIDRCGNTGTISAGNSQAGGIVGDADSGVTTISNSYNTGNISTEYGNAGGIIGQTAKSFAQESVTNCYSSGECTATSNLGSLIGLCSSKGIVENCYVLDTAAGKAIGSDYNNQIANVTAKTAAEMQSADFAALLGDAFEYNPGGYPVLKGTSAAPEPPVTDTYSVSFDLDGGKLGNTETAASQTVEKGGTASDPGTPAKEGYDFKGWYNGDTKFDFSEAVTSDITLKAKWEAKEYTVKFDLNGGTVYDPDSGKNLTTIPDKKVKYGEKLSKIWVSAPKGYIQDGWYNGDKKFDFDNDVVKGDMTLTYKWNVSTYDVKFNAVNKDNGRTITNTTIKVTYKDTYYDEDIYEDVEYDATLTPDSSGVYKMRPGKEYSYTISANGYTPVTGKFTPSGDDINITKTIEMVNVSEDYSKVKKIADKFNSDKALLRARYGADSNVNDMIKAIISQYNLDIQGVEVSLASTSDQSVIAANGTINYNTEGIPNLSRIYTKRVDITVNFKCGNEQATSDEAVVQVGGNLAYFKQNMQNEADQLTFEKIKGDNDAADNITSDLTLPRTITSAGNTSGISMQAVWSEAEWSSDSDAITITKPEFDISNIPATGTIHQGNKDQVVTLTAKFKANGVLLNDRIPGETVDNIGYITKTFKVTVKGDPSKTDEKAKLQQELQEKIDKVMTGGSQGLINFSTGKPLDLSNVTSNIKFPTTRDLGVDGSKQPVTIESSDENYIEPWKKLDGSGTLPNASTVNVYRPIQGEDPVNVDLTLRITDKETGVSASKTVTVTLNPISDEELNARKDLMKKAISGYWDGIKNQNTDKTKVTSDLQPFQEIVDDNGGIKFIYNADEKTYSGISPETYAETIEPTAGDDQYTWFNSSVSNVIAKSSLKVTKPEYDRNVTIDSYLSDNVYGKYYTKYKNSDPEKAAKFKDLYRQHASADVTVLGEKGQDENPDAMISVNVSITGVDGFRGITKTLSVSKYATAADVVIETLKENGYHYSGDGNYISGITDPSGKELKQKSMGDNSGWMYRVNGVLPDKLLSQYVLADGDTITLFYTKDYTQEGGMTGDDTEFTVVFDLDGGTVNGKTAIETQKVAKGGKANAPAAPTKKGYTFGGWYSGNSKFDFSMPVTGNITLKAKWTKKGEAAPKPTPKPAKIKVNRIFASGSYSGKTVAVKWNKVKTARGYDIFMAKCGTKGKLAQKKYLAKSVNKGTIVKAYLKTLRGGKKLSSSNSYKVQVKAYNIVKGKKHYLTSSPAIHLGHTKNGTYTNAVKVSVSPKNVTLKTGKTKTIKAKAYKENSAKKWIAKSHADKIRYYTTNSSVASVSSSGKIKAKKKGTCTVYAMAANGVKAKVNVTVK